MYQVDKLSAPTLPFTVIKQAFNRRIQKLESKLMPKGIPLKIQVKKKLQAKCLELVEQKKSNKRKITELL